MGDVAALADLLTLVRAEVLCLDSSSFASLAYFCRTARQPAVIGVKHVKSFFHTDHVEDGGRHGVGAVPAWPPNLLYAFKGLQRAAEGTDAWDKPLLKALEDGLKTAAGYDDLR